MSSIDLTTGISITSPVGWADANFANNNKNIIFLFIQNPLDCWQARLPSKYTHYSIEKAW